MSDLASRPVPGEVTDEYRVVELEGLLAEAMKHLDRWVDRSEGFVEFEARARAALQEAENDG